MMAFMVEILITTFAFGGILGAVVALHLSSNLKESANSRESAPATIELAPSDEAAELKPVPVDTASRRAAGGHRRHR
jgi:hypothetical protein